MTNLEALALAFLAGIILGAFFFGGLWWTIQKGITSQTPALWFIGSLLLRTAVILVGFYLVAQDHWSRFVICILGFLLARVIVVNRFAGAPKEKQIPVEQETNHAH
jgi:F1F0 ATPase subunit 2